FFGVVSIFIIQAMGKRAIRVADALARGHVVGGGLVPLAALSGRPDRDRAAQAQGGEPYRRAMAAKTFVALPPASRVETCQVVRVCAGRSPHSYRVAAASNLNSNNRAHGPERGTVGGASRSRAGSHKA